nr:MAG TPA: hypothetical protein [Bacteriophage sp.]
MLFIIYIGIEDYITYSPFSFIYTYPSLTFY